jgi:hypothetical protein
MLEHEEAVWNNFPQAACRIRASSSRARRSLTGLRQPVYLDHSEQLSVNQLSLVTAHKHGFDHDATSRLQRKI